MKTLPCIAWTLIACGWTTLAAAAPELQYSSTRELEISTRTIQTGAAPVTGYQLWFTRDGGQSWERTEQPHLGPPPIAFTAPSDGEFGFLVKARDRSGRGDEPPQPGTEPDVTCVVDSTRPYLEVREPSGAEPIYSGSQLVFDYRVEDPHLGERPVRIEWRKTTDNVWQDILPDERYPAHARQTWWPSVVRGQIEVRVSVQDLAGNQSQWVSQPLTVVEFDGFTASRTVAADPYSSFRRLPIFYRIPEFSPIELATIEIWWRQGSNPWQRTEDPDRVSPFRFEAPGEGNFFFYVRGISRNGIASRPAPGPDTPPDHRTVIDTMPPRGTLRLGDGDPTEYRQAGGLLPVYWQVDDENLAPAHCRLEYSIDGGHRWRTLWSDLEFHGGAGGYTWNAPSVELEDLRMRIVARDLAGNETLLTSTNRIHLINPAVDPALAAEKHYRRGLFLGRQGDRESREAAVELLGVSLNYDSSDPDVWHDRGVLQMMLNRPLAALTDFQRSNEMRPGDLGFAFSLIRAHVNLHRLGLQPDLDHLAAARELLAGISRIDIYKQPNFRELLASYNLLAEAVGNTP